MTWNGQDWPSWYRGGWWVVVGGGGGSGAESE